VRAQRTLELTGPLATAIPAQIDGFDGKDIQLTPEEISAVGVTSYLSRVFENPDSAGAGPRWFQVYVGYYDRQASGRTIHSPKNCLPGGGWEPLTSTTAQVQTPGGPVTVNRYLIQNSQHHQALVFYWYQGRGRVAFNEYAVKWDLVRDAALRRRSEEALVRIVVPVRDSEEPSLALATRVASRLVPSLHSVLPG
jgi:EpsI family protein